MITMKKNKLKLLIDSFKSLDDAAFESKDNLKSALNDFLSRNGLPIVPDSTPDVMNKAAPTFDTLDYDEISSHFQN